MSPELPPLLALPALATGIAGAAALANCALLAAILKRSRDGLSAILIQLSIADFLLLGGVYGPEIWAINSGSWTFGYTACIVFQGLGVFGTTASVYLVATVALHSLATVNCEEKAIYRRRKRTEEEEDEIRSSRHSLVATSDSSTPPRTMHIDYRQSRTRVRVAPPTIFVWILATSLSIPEFTLSTTIPSEDGKVYCLLIESSHRKNMHLMLAMFDQIFPVLIYGVIMMLIIVKLNSVKRVLDAQNELIASLRLSLCLMVVSCALGAPRTSATTLLQALSAESSLVQPDKEAMLRMLFSGLALLATLVRPLLCIFILPSLLKTFHFGAQSHGVDV